MIHSSQKVAANPAIASPRNYNSKKPYSKKSPFKRCLGRLVESLYSAMLIAIGISVCLTVYKSFALSSSSHSVSGGVPTWESGPQSPKRSLEKMSQKSSLLRKEDEQQELQNDNTPKQLIQKQEETTEIAFIVAPPSIDYSQYLVQPGDFIYQKLPGESAPIVLEEFNLVFFAQAKVACTVWKMLFRRMMGYEDWQSIDLGLPHVPERNGLTYLYHYNISRANEIMTSSEWTRAIFVRSPKERFLSAYLDKAVENFMFLDTCCNRNIQVYCNLTPPALHDFLATIPNCSDSHWDPQSKRMEEKYWPYINFVGNLETVQDDAKRLMQNLHVWEDYGLHGWGESQSQAIFESKDGLFHAQNAKSKLQEYMYPELEQRVEEYYSKDYANPWFNLSESRKFPESEDADLDPINVTALNLPIVEPRDWIYRIGRYPEAESSPIVVEKYKLVFFVVPHVADNEFKRLFARMMGFDDWKTRKYDKSNPNAINEGLVYLRDFNLTRASEIMTSPTWTRAIFVRDPKERFALAYSHTAKRNRGLLHQICCIHSKPKIFCLKDKSTRSLLSAPSSVEFFKGIKTCKSTLWDPLTERLSALERMGLNAIQNAAYDPKGHAKNKYWKHIDFVGNVGNPEDVKTILEKIGVWNDFGASGWADVPGDVIARRDSFLGTTSYLKAEFKAKQHVQSVIKDPKMEEDLEKFYFLDYKNPWFNMTKQILYSSKGNTYGNAVNELAPDVRQAQLENANAKQRQW